MKLGVSYGGPTIAKGRLLQFDRFGDDERLTCFNAETAEELWRVESKMEYEDMLGYNNGPRCSPVVDGDYIYTFGVSGLLTCWQLEDGKKIWQKDTQKEYGVVQNFFGVASAPYVYKDLLLVMIGGSPPSSQLVNAREELDLVKPNGTAVVAFNKLTGKEVYRVGNDLSSYASMTVREINGKATGLAFLRSGLMAFEPESGKEIFKFPWRASLRDSVNAALPITRGNQILLSEAYEIGSALLSVTGGKTKTVWQDSGSSLRKHAFRAHWSTPVWVGDYLYGCSGRNQPDADFRCIRMSDGKVQWAERRHERSSVLLVDGYLIVLGEYGRLELVKGEPAKVRCGRQSQLQSNRRSNRQKSVARVSMLGGARSFTWLALCSRQRPLNLLGPDPAIKDFTAVLQYLAVQRAVLDFFATHIFAESERWVACI